MPGTTTANLPWYWPLWRHNFLQVSRLRWTYLLVYYYKDENKRGLWIFMLSVVGVITDLRVSVRLLYDSAIIIDHRPSVLTSLSRNHRSIVMRRKKLSSQSSLYLITHLHRQTIYSMFYTDQNPLRSKLFGGLVITFIHSIPTYETNFRPMEEEERGRIPVKSDSFKIFPKTNNDGLFWKEENSVPTNFDGSFLP